jgi:hypothetical protein
MAFLQRSGSGQDGRAAKESASVLPRGLAKWLGPQYKPATTTVDAKRLEKLYTIKVNIVRGEELADMKNLHNVVHLDRTITNAPDEWQQQIEGGSKYLVGQISQKGKYGIRVYTLDCKIESGPLKGAIVHLRDGTFPPEMTDYTAYYRLPTDVEMDNGELEFTIARCRVK